MFDIFSALEQSKEEGELIGQKRGEQIGQKRGEQIGENRGRMQERLETARGLLADNVPDDKVIRYSRIIAGELEKLKEELRDKASER